MNLFNKIAMTVGAGCGVLAAGTIIGGFLIPGAAVVALPVGAVVGGWLGKKTADIVEGAENFHKNDGYDPKKNKSNN